MKFDHMVKYEGVYYQAGQEVPVKGKEEEKKPIPTVPILEDTPDVSVEPPKRRGRKPREE